MNSVKCLAVGFSYGLKDSFLGIFLLSNIDNDQKGKAVEGRPSSKHGERQSRPDTKRKGKVLPMMAQCCFLNGGVLLLSVMVFERYIVPAVKYIMMMMVGLVMVGNGPQSSLWSWMEPTMNYIFKYLWVVPLFWLCKILNIFWFVEIADVAYRKKFGRPVSSLLSSKDSIFKVLSKTMADFVFSINVEVCFLLQAQLVGLIPIFGPALSFIHMSLLYSLYAFEYTWTNLGWTVVRRLGYIENNWPYFIGFGVLLSTLTSLTSSAVISACIFGITFPIFILSGLDARPYEQCDYPVRLFSLAIWLTNKVFLIKSSGKKLSQTDLSS